MLNATTLRTVLLFLLVLCVPSTVIAQDKAPNPDISKFLPENAQLIKQLSVTFDHQQAPSVVLAYAVKTGDYDYQTGVRVLDYQGLELRDSFEGKGLVSTGGGNPMNVEKVRSSSGEEAAVVIQTFSGAGTSTAWHVLAKIGRKFADLDVEQVRNAVLKRKG